MALLRFLSQVDKTPKEFIKDFPHVILGAALVLIGVIWLLLGFRSNIVIQAFLIGGCLLCIVGLYTPLNKS